MSSPSSQSSMKMLNKKHVVCFSVALLSLFLLYVLFRTPTTKGGDSCSCCGEGFTPALRVLDKEGLKSTYSVESPALKAMFEQQQKEHLKLPPPLKLRNVNQERVGSASHPIERISYVPRQKGIEEQFDVMRGTPVDKNIQTKSNEGFMREFTYPQQMRSTGSETANNPFVGPISL